MTKNSRQELRYLENKKSFEVKLKAFFIIFKWLAIAKNCLRPESTPLNGTKQKICQTRKFR